MPSCVGAALLSPSRLLCAFLVPSVCRLPMGVWVVDGRGASARGCGSTGVCASRERLLLLLMVVDVHFSPLAFLDSRF